MDEGECEATDDRQEQTRMSTKSSVSAVSALIGIHGVNLNDSVASHGREWDKATPSTRDAKLRNIRNCR